MWKKKSPTKRQAKHAAREHLKNIGLIGDPFDTKGWEEFGYCPKCRRGYMLDRCRKDYMDWPCCPDDGSRLELPRREDVEAGALALFLKWLTETKDKGMWGPSPSEAAAYLGCHRTTIDDLVDGHVLHRSEYKDDYGHHVVMISSRSLESAIRNKAETGSYTGKPLGRPKASMKERGTDNKAGRTA